jgi:DNA-binding LacI/PurR family transcriptional regulator
METPLYKQLYTYILEEIKSGRLRKGDRVPSEKELAEKFGVSRITSKKAFEVLSQAGIIERSRGKGSFVSNTLPDPGDLDGLVSGESGQVHTPNPAKDESRLIGLVLPHFAEAFGLRLLHSIEEHAALANCHLVLKRTYGSQCEEEQAIRSLIRLNVDGLIVLPVHGEHYNAELLRLALDGFPLVLVDRFLKGIDTYAVYTDNRRAATQLTDLLLDQGHERIAFLSPPIENTSALEDRFYGYTAALTARNIIPHPDYCLTSLRSTLPPGHEEWQEADRKALELFVTCHPEVTAFVACEYSLALMLYRLLTSMGKKLAVDYAVVCFDSLKEPIGTPLFTHIRQNERAMGKCAVEKLIGQIEGKPDSEPKHTMIDFTLVVGKSTTAPLRTTTELRAE